MSYHLYSTIIIVQIWKSAKVLLTSIARVHSDKHWAGRIQLNLSAFEEKDSIPRVDPSLDGEDLLGHHRENFQVDAIELVKAWPGPTRGKALEKFPQGYVIQSVRTVEDNTLEEGEGGGEKGRERERVCVWRL